MCLCAWNNFSMERDKGLDQGSSDHGWLRQGFWWVGTEILQQMKFSSPELLS